jgi:hypothetical protein
MDMTNTQPHTRPEAIRDTDAIMTSACVECGDEILHGEGWTEWREFTALAHKPQGWKYRVAHHHDCKPQPR